MQSIPYSLVKWIPIKFRGAHAAWLNAVDSMQSGKMHPYWMQWIPCSESECGGLEGAGCRSRTSSNEEENMQHDCMQWILCSMAHSFTIQCSVFHAAWGNGTLWNAADFMLRDWMQGIPCSMIECSGFYAAWPKASRWNAVDSMHCDWMQCNPCRVVKCIPIECSGFHAAWLNAVDSMQGAVMEPYWMQWILCSMIECSGFNAAWLHAVDFMQHGP